MKRHRRECDVWKYRDRGEVQMDRLAATLEANHGPGATQPRKVPGVEERRRATNLERYGAENLFSRSSSVYDVVRKRSDAARPILRGENNPFSKPAVQAKIRETNLLLYGVENPQSSIEVRRRTQETNLERYGVKETLASPLVRARGREALIRKFGVPHHMQNRGYLAKFFEKAGRPGPNLLERRFGALNPELLYTGNGAFWRWLPKLGQHKNPDFISPGPDITNPKKGVTKVVEVFGDFWHSRMFTGRANFEHELALVEAYLDVGIECLIIWEGDFKKDSDATRKRVVDFLVTPV